MKSIIIVVIAFVLLVLIASYRVQAQILDPKTDLWGYELTFYEVNIDSVVKTVYEGDTLEIRWDAPVSRVPYDLQPDYHLKGTWTGVSHKVLVSNDDILYNGNVEFNKKVSLGSGYWELTIRAIDLNDEFSKESDSFIFQVISVPPGVPARVYIIIK
jgi:hypothetical protein